MIRRALWLGAAYWAIVFAVGFALGIVRTGVVAPWIGATAAVLCETPIILAASWTVATWLLRWHSLPASGRAVMGGVALILLLASEALFAAFLTGASLGDWAASLIVVPGIIGFAAQLVFAAMPLFLRDAR